MISHNISGLHGLDEGSRGVDLAIVDEAKSLNG